MAARVLALLVCLATIAIAGASASADATTRPGCVMPSAAVLTRLPTHGVVIGDMNGDGRADRVSIAVHRRARLACRYVLVADLGSAVLTTFVRQPYVNEQLGKPQLVELARVNRGGGAQAIVNFGGGAYVDAFGLYDISRGHLVRVKVMPLEQETFANAFGQGASLAFGEVSFCADGPGEGRILEVGLGHTQKTWKRSAAPYGSLYVQHGESYHLVGWKHHLTPAERKNVWARPPRAAPRAEVFANCAIASTR